MYRNRVWLSPRWPPLRAIRARTALIYGVLLAAALLARLDVIATKQSIQHDEAISYLAAAGHMRDYALVVDSGRSPYNAWVPAREWQRFIQPGDTLNFAPIARDLADYDIHPPLYFWLLHIWILIFGVTAWAGPLLNLLIDLGTALALYRLARPTNSPVTVVALWALSPVALVTMSVARQYGLFTLLAVCYAPALRAALSSESPRSAHRWSWVALMLISAAGLLTYYYFVLVLLAGGIAALIRRDTTRLLWFVVCTLLAGALMVGLHPDFLVPVQQRTGHGFEWSAMGVRVENLIGTLNILLIPVLAALLLPLIGGLLRGHFKTSPLNPLSTRGEGTCQMTGSPSLCMERGTRGEVKLFKRLLRIGRGEVKLFKPARISQDTIFLMCLTLGPAALYLCQISPVHALMDYRYFGPAWPFATLLIVRALDGSWFARLGEMRRTLACLGMLLLTAVLFLPDLRDYTKPEPETRILIDNTARGVLLPLVFQLDGETPVYAAEPSDLLAAPEQWLSPLVQSGGLYSQYPNATSDRAANDEILRLIATSARVSEATALYLWQADLWRDEEQVYIIGPAVSP